MSDIIQTVVLTGAPTLTYFSLALAESLGAIEPITVIEKFGISGVVFLFALWVVKWLLNERNDLKKEIEKLRDESNANHEKRLEEQRKYFEQMTDLFKK
jgi:hypothetical protein